MDLTQYPLLADVQGLLTAAGLWPTDATEAANAVTEIGVAIPATVADWETRTGWQPFLAPAGNTTRTFQARPGSAYVDLGAGLLTLNTLTVAGVAQVVNTDFWLRARATTTTYPYDWISFAARIPATPYPADWLEFDQFQPQGMDALPPTLIVISGRWGYCAPLVADAWDAIRQGAAAAALLKMAIASTGEVIRVAQGPSRQSFEIGVKRHERITDWQTFYELTLARHTRVVV